MKIIAFGYRKGVGKDTAGKFLSNYLRLNAPKLQIKQLGFATKLKDICYQLYGWAGLKRGVYYESHRSEKEVLLPKLGCTPRGIWIQVGNKMRQIWPMTWVDFVLRGISADVLIITDLRFRNEARVILKIGGTIIKINRPGLVKGTDPAEIDLDSWAEWDHIIDNIGTLQDLNYKIEQIAQKELLK